MKENYSYREIHPYFRWNGGKLRKIQLLELAEEYSYSKEKYLQEIGLFFKQWFDQNHLIEVQTSGSTGTPKKMKVKKQYMLNSAKATQEFFNLPAGTKALLCLPATYIAGKLMIVRSLVLGWEIDSVKPSAHPLKINQKKYDFTAFTPYQLNHSLEDLHLVKKVMVGGGAVSKSLLNKIRKVSTEIYETYAMTETLTHIAARRINAPNQKHIPPFELLKDIKIEQSEEGCLIIHAPKVSDQVVYTNDLVKLQTSSSFYLLGRLDNVINSGGIKLIPEKIEEKLSAIIPQRFFVYGEADAELGERLVLFIEGNFTKEEFTNLKNKIHSYSLLEKYELPKQIYNLSEFSQTTSGKIKRKETFNRFFNNK